MLASFFSGLRGQAGDAAGWLCQPHALELPSSPRKSSAMAHVLQCVWQLARVQSNVSDFCSTVGTRPFLQFCRMCLTFVQPEKI